MMASDSPPLCRDPARIDIGCVDEGEAGIDEGVEQPVRGRLVGRPAEHVAPKAMGANSMPDLPSLRFSWLFLLVWIPGLLAAARAAGSIPPKPKAAYGGFGEFYAELG